MSHILDSINECPKRYVLPGFVPWPDDFIDRYRRAGYWHNETFGDVLFECAAKYGDRIALTSGENKWIVL
jgi:2,3-dihydroxybenzoate-AMP ligase